MNNNAIVRVRIHSGLRANAEAVFRRLGLSTTQAITLFYEEAVLRGGLPFDVTVPSKATKQAFEDVDTDRDLIVCEDADDMFRRLGL